MFRVFLCMFESVSSAFLFTGFSILTAEIYIFGPSYSNMWFITPTIYAFCFPLAFMMPHGLANGCCKL